MFCNTCGNPLEDGAVFCPICGASVEKEAPAEPAAPIEEVPVIPENPYPEEVEYPAFDLNTEGEVSKPKKKISAVPFLIGGIAVVVAAVLLSIFFWPKVSGFFTRTFSSPDKLQSKVYEDVVAQTFDKINVAEKDDKKDNNAIDPKNVGIEGEIRFSVDEQLLSLIVPQTGMDMSWLSDIAIGFDSSVKDNLVKVAMSAILGDTSIASADVMMNQETMEYWISVPELNDQALYMNYMELMEETGMAMNAMMDPEMMAQIQELLPEQEKLEEIITRYVGVLMSSFGDVEKSNDKVKVGGVSQQLHVLKATMDEDDLVKAVKTLIKTLKKDKDIEDIILSVEEYMGEEGLYDSFVTAMDEALEAMNEEDMELPSFKLVLTTYLNNANDIVGIAAKITTNMGMKVTIEPFSWVRVEQGKKFASELVISTGEQSIVFEGKGEKDKTTNSEYTLSFDGEEILTVEVEDYLFSEDEISGTVRIMPSERIMELAMSEMDLDGAILDLIGSASPALELEMSGKRQDAKFAIALVTGTKKLVSIGYSCKVTTPDAIEIPTDYVSIEDEDSIMDWAENMDEDFLSTLMERLMEAGVPAELFEFAA